MRRSRTFYSFVVQTIKAASGRPRLAMCVAFLMAMSWFVSIHGEDGTDKGSGPREEGQASFTFTTDKKHEVFKRPLIRFTPPKDKNGKRPHEVIAAFLTAVQDQKYDVAEECVNLLPNRTGFSEPEAISQEEFHRLCDRYLQFADGGNVLLDATAINSKGEIWGVSYRLQTGTGDVRSGVFNLEQQAGEWNILSKDPWYEWGRADYDLEKERASKDGRVPHW